MGRESDATIASLAGVAESTVVAYRRKLGIALGGSSPRPAGGAPKRAANAPRKVPFRPRSSRLGPFVHLLGVKSDAEVGALCDMVPANVRRYRERRGIPAPSGAAPPAPAPPADTVSMTTTRNEDAEKPAQPKTASLWSVELKQGVYAVVADDISLAARVAFDRAAGREIGAIRRVAPMI